MNLLNNKDVESFQDLFSKKVMVGQDEIASKNITPSKMACEVYEAFRLQGRPQAGEMESFESRGYAESGNSRHQAIQKFLKENPNVEWIEPEEYIKENNLPFDVEYSFEVSRLMRNHPDITLNEARDLLGDYEVKLKHKNQPLVFKLDGLIKYKDIYYILEIKTIGRKDMADVPLDKHQPQGLTYSYLLKINHIAWVYESREDFKIKVVFQEVRPEEHQSIRNSLNNIIINQNNITKLHRETSKCQYCRYHYLCLELFVATREGDMGPF